MSLDILSYDDLPLNLLAGARVAVAYVGPPEKGYKLALGTAALRNVGTTANTVAAGDDPRFSQIGTSFTLTPATANTLGGIKVGTGLTAAGDGTLSITNVPLSVIGQGGATTGQVLGWSGTAWGPMSLPASVSPSSATPRFPQDADLSPLYDSANNEYVTTPAAQSAYTIGKLQAAGARFAKAVSVAPVTLAYAASVTIDPTASNQIRIGTLTGNITLANPTTLVSGNDGLQFEVTLKQDATGGRTVTLGTLFLLATGDAIPTTASSVVRLGCTWDSVAGVIRAAVSKVWAA